MNKILSVIQTNDERFWKRLTIGLLALIVVLSLAQPAVAHHPFGGEAPNNWWEGFLSGLGHPVIGFDHLAFVIASGLVAANTKRGWIIPLGFVMAAIAGTGLHLQGVNLPLLEVMIAASVIAMGGFLVLFQSNNVVGESNYNNQAESFSYSLLIALGSAIAGIFHGYAYGEAIVGAEMTPLLAYLAGFTLIQLGIALGSYKLAQTLLAQVSTPSVPLTRLMGCGIMGMGVVFVTSAI